MIKVVKIVAILCLCAFLLIILAGIEYALSETITVFITTDISDYGKISGNNNNYEPKQFIFSFFPDEISPVFSDVKYYYRAQKYGIGTLWDDASYTYEAWLEVTIKDKVVFEEYLSKVSQLHTMVPFKYANGLYECNISDVFRIYSYAQSSPYPVNEALIGKIIISPDSQNIFFVAIGVDGHRAYTDDISYFFLMFDIDPKHYSES